MLKVVSAKMEETVMRRENNANIGSLNMVIGDLLSHLPPNPRLAMELKIIVQEFDKMLRQCNNRIEQTQIRKVMVEFFKQYEIQEEEKGGQ